MPCSLKGFAEEGFFGLRLEVLAAVSEVSVSGMGGREGILRCRKA